MDLSRFALGERLRRTPYIRKWVLLGSLIGVISGIGAIVFYLGLEFATLVFILLLAGY